MSFSSNVYSNRIQTYNFSSVSVLSSGSIYVAHVQPVSHSFFNLCSYFIWSFASSLSLFKIPIAIDCFALLSTIIHMYGTIYTLKYTHTHEHEHTVASANTYTKTHTDTKVHTDTKAHSNTSPSHRHTTTQLLCIKSFSNDLHLMLLQNIPVRHKQLYLRSQLKRIIFHFSVSDYECACSYCFEHFFLLLPDSFVSRINRRSIDLIPTLLSRFWLIEWLMQASVTVIVAIDWSIKRFFFVLSYALADLHRQTLPIFNRINVLSLFSLYFYILLCRWTKFPECEMILKIMCCVMFPTTGRGEWMIRLQNRAGGVTHSCPNTMHNQ